MFRQVNYLERKYGRTKTAFLVALFTLIISAIYCRPSLTAQSHGVYYAELSRNPWSPNPYPHRILTPLIAYLIGLRGNSTLLFNVLLLLIFLALIHGSSRKVLPARTTFLLTLCISLSMPVLFTLYYGGYTDIASYFLLFLTIISVENPVLLWFLYLLNLFNRESMVFFLPLLFYLRLYQVRKIEKATPGTRTLLLDLALATMFTASYGVFYLYVMETRLPQQSLHFYLSPLSSDPLFWIKQVALAYPIGVFSVFKLLWLIPAYAFIECFRVRDLHRMTLIALPVLLASAQSFIALDTSRMLSYAFPSFIWSFKFLYEKHKRNVTLFEHSVIMLLTLNLLVPELYVTSNHISIMTSLPMKMLQKTLL